MDFKSITVPQKIVEIKEYYSNNINEFFIMNLKCLTHIYKFKWSLNKLFLMVLLNFNYSKLQPLKEIVKNMSFKLILINTFFIYD